MSLDDLDDSCGTRNEQNKQSRFSKRLHSPDRSVWDTSMFFPGGSSKNEIEKMFEKFKIKMAADDEIGEGSDHVKTHVRPAVSDAVTDSDFSPAHSEYSKLIHGVNKTYASAVDDDKRADNFKDTKRDGEKTAEKKHKRRKDKPEKEKKSRHSKSKSKHAAEPESAVVVPVGTQSVQQLSIQQTANSPGHHTSDNDIHHSFSHSVVAVHVADSADLGLPSVHASCHTNVVFSETLGEWNADEAGAADLNPLDYSTSKLIPQTSTGEVRCAGLIFICFCLCAFCVLFVADITLVYILLTD